MQRVVTLAHGATCRPCTALTVGYSDRALPARVTSSNVVLTGRADRAGRPGGDSVVAESAERGVGAGRAVGYGRGTGETGGTVEVVACDAGKTESGGSCAGRAGRGAR